MDTRIEAPRAGRLTHKAKQGETLAHGAPIAVIEA